MCTRAEGPTSKMQSIHPRTKAQPYMENTRTQARTWGSWGTLCNVEREPQRQQLCGSFM